MLEVEGVVCAGEHDGGTYVGHEVHPSARILHQSRVRPQVEH